jgi:hypothetical protein
MISLCISVKVKCSRMMKNVQIQLNELRRENRKLMRRLNNNTGGNNTVNTNGSGSPHTNGNDVPRLDTIDDSSNEHNGAQSMALVKAEKRAQSDDEADNSIDHGPLHNGMDKDNIDGEQDDDSVTHFEDYANGIDDECPDLEEIGNGIKEEEDHDGLDGFRINPEPYGEKTIDEDDMEAYFNDENFMCRICNRQLCSRHSLMRHVKTVHTAHRRYKCDFCNSCFKSADVKKVHIKNVHGGQMATNNERPYAKVYKTSPKKPRLDLSNVSENGDENHDLLEPRPTMALAITNGITNNIKTEAPKIFSCSICKERFASRGEISGHSRRVHGNAKPFKCEFCDAGFTRIGTLNAHMKKHTM